jgi:hypothetical protein
MNKSRKILDTFEERLVIEWDDGANYVSYRQWDDGVYRKEDYDCIVDPRTVPQVVVDEIQLIKHAEANLLDWRVYFTEQQLIQVWEVKGTKPCA